MKRIMVAFMNLTDDQKRRIEESAAGCEIRYAGSSGVSAEDIEYADILLGNVPPSLLHEPDLELFMLNSAGADAFTPKGMLKRDTILCCATGAYNKAVSEHALAVTFALQKRLHQYRDNQNKAVWKHMGAVTSLSDSTVLVVGLGEIGLAYAKLVKALGAYVIGIRRREGEKPDFIDEIYTTDRTDELIPRADVIVSILPRSDQTNHFFNEDRFALMKDTAIFINCGRGNSVAQDALYETLKNGRIYAAGVDVFENEPLNPGSPLWKLENILITPHCAGHFYLEGTLDNVVDIWCRNLRAYLGGGELVNVVDYKTGYRK